MNLAATMSLDASQFTGPLQSTNSMMRAVVLNMGRLDVETTSLAKNFAAAMGKVNGVAGPTVRATDKIDAAFARLPFRMKQHVSSAVLAMSGIDSPVTMFASRLEYLQYVADRTGMSLGQIFTRMGPTIAAVAGAALVINKAISLSKETDEALKAAGLSAQGFWKNLAMGYGIIEGPRIKTTIDLEVYGQRIAEEHISHIKRMAEELTHEPSVVENVQGWARPKEEAIARRRAALQAPSEELVRSQDAVAKIEDTAVGTPSRQLQIDALFKSLFRSAAKPGDDPEKMLDKIKSELEERRAALHQSNVEIRKSATALQRETQQQLIEATYGEPLRKANLAETEGRHEEAAQLRSVIEDVRAEGVPYGGSRSNEIEAEHKGAAAAAADSIEDNRAHLEALASDERRAYEVRGQAIVDLGELEKQQAKGPGERELIDQRTEKALDALDEAENSKNEPRTPGGHVGSAAPQIDSDRLAKIGLFIGGGGGPAADHSRRTADNTAQLVKLISGWKVGNGCEPVFTTQ